MLILAIIYVFILIAAILAAFVLMFIPTKRRWMEFISSASMGSLGGLLFAHAFVFLIFWLASLLSIRIRLYPVGTLFGPLGPSGTDWPNILISILGIAIGAIVGVGLPRRSRRKNLD